MVNDLRGDLYAHLQRLSLAYHTPTAGRRPDVPDHLGQLCRPDDDHERAAADPVGGDPARRHADRAVSDGSDADLAVADDRAGPVRHHCGVQPQDRRCRDRGARPRQPGLLARAMGHGGDQGRAGLHQGGGGAPPLHGRQPRKPACDAEPLQLADALFGRGQRRRRGRHSGCRVCRRPGGAVRQSDARPADRVHLLPGAAIPADQPDHPELGPDRGGAGRREAGVRGAGDRGRPEERHASVSVGRRARRHRLARCQLPLPAGDAGVERHRHHGARPAPRSRSSARPAPANRPCSACCRASSTRRPAASRSTASTFANTR